MTVFLIILGVFAVIFLLPIRVKASVGDGKWSVEIYYAFIPVLRRGSKPPPPPDAVPPKPGDDLSEEQLKEVLPTADTSVKPAEEAEEDTAEETPAETAEETAGETIEGTAAETAEETPETDSAKTDRATLESADTSDQKGDKETAAGADSPKADETGGEEKAEKKPEEGGESPKKKNFFQRLKPEGLSDILGLVSDGGTALSPGLKFLFRHLHFRHVNLWMAVGSDDAAKTAQLYGTISTAVFNLLAAAQCALDIQTDSCRILADFFGDKIAFRVSLELRCSAAGLVGTVLVLGVKFLLHAWKRFRAQDREAKREERESRPVPADS